MANPNATNPITRPSGDRNEKPATESQNAKEASRRQDDLMRQAQATKASGQRQGSS